MDNKYKLTINGLVKYYDNYDNAFNAARDAILDHVKAEEQSYYNFMSFNMGAHINELYDTLRITDEEIILFEKTDIVLSRLFESNDTLVKFIKNDYVYESDEKEYSIKIIKEEDNGLIISIKSLNDYFITNMFNIRPNHNYYFESKQLITTRSRFDKRNLGEEAYIKVILECI